MKIGLVGLIGAGKDTFADYLVRYLDGYEITRFALPLKLLTCRIFGMSLAAVEDRVLKERDRPFDADHAIDEIFKFLQYKLKFTHEEMDLASERYFEYFTGIRSISPRLFQQWFGTEVVRHVRPNAWRDLTINKKGNHIITDVRFSNEAAAMDVLIGIKRETNPERPEHASEHFAYDILYGRGVEGIRLNATIVNNYTLEALDHAAMVLASHIKTSY